MSNIRMGAAEAKFADLIWDNEPLTSGQLVKLAAQALEWKRTTSFTVLKRLCERGLFQNDGGMVTSLMSREAYYTQHSQQYVEETFGGSLPAFLTAFISRKLTDEELEELQQMIDKSRR